MANRVVIEVEGRFEDNITAPAQAAARALDALERRVVEPSISAENSTFVSRVRESENRARDFGRTRAEATLVANDQASSRIARVWNAARRFASGTYRAILAVRDSDAMTALRNINAQAKSIAGKTWNAAVRIKDYATAPLQKVKDMLFSIKSLVLAITAGVAAQKLIANPVSLADSYASAKIGFSTLLGDTRGQQMMNDLDAFAKATPFKTSEVIANSQMMLAMGWQAQDIIADMQTIGDAAAATGKGDEGLNRIVLALSQIKSKGKLSTEELNQLAEAGISAKRYLAEGLGYGTGDTGIAALSEDLQKGEIGAETAIQAIMQGMKEYAGMMDRTANETVSGLWSQIEDTFEINVFRRWGQGLQDGAKRGLGAIVELLDNADAALGAFGDTLYEVGKTISNFAADKLETLVSRSKNITGSAEFQSAGLGDKLKMLWSGAIANPFAGWWTGTVVPWWNDTALPWLAEKAGSIGEKIGTGLSNGLLALLGIDMTDAAEEGASIAASFVSGFLEGFDGSAISSAIVSAVGNVWDALPWYGKLLAGGYATTKTMSGMMSAATGLETFFGNARTLLGISGAAAPAAAGVAEAGPAVAGAGAVAAGTGAATATGTSALLPIAATAGGIVAVGTLISGGRDLYKGIMDNDLTTEQANAYAGSGALKGGFVTAGALIGGTIGGIPGALIGAGIGGIAGLIVGEGLKSNANSKATAERQAREQAEALALREQEEAERIAQAEAEAAALADLESRFGSLTLSADEVQTAVQNMIGRDVINRANAVSAAVEQMNSSFSAFENAASALDKNLWLTTTIKSGELTASDTEALMNSAQSYLSAADTYLTDAQYASSEAISYLLRNEKNMGQVLNSSTAYYDEQRGKLSELSQEFNDSLTEALSDGVLGLDEEASLANIRGQIADIIQQIQQNDYEAEMRALKAKYGSDVLSRGSFEQMLSSGYSTTAELSASNYTAFGQATKGMDEASSGYKALQNALYGNEAENWLNLGNLGLDKIKSSWLDDLDLSADINSIFAVKNKQSLRDAAESLGDEGQSSLAAMLKYMQPTTEQIQLLANSYENMGLAVPRALTQFLQTAEFYEALAAGPDAISAFYDQYTIEVNPILELMQDQLELAASASADVDVDWTYDPFKKEWISPDKKYSFDAVAAANLGWTYNPFEEAWISPDGQYIFYTNVTVRPDYTIGAKFYATQEAFNIPKQISFSTNVLVTPTYAYNNSRNNISTPLNQARGGIHGIHGLESFASGGMVHGGGKLVRVAEEGSPEMIIPLGSQRRERGLKLWEKAGELLRVPGFALGGRTDGGDEGLRFRSSDGESVSGASGVSVELGGVSVQIHVDAGSAENVAAVIQAQAGEIAETVAGILDEALQGVFANTPRRAAT